jgi:hypothetical protein
MTITVDLALGAKERDQLAGILGCTPNQLDTKFAPYVHAAADEYARMFLGQRVFVMEETDRGGSSTVNITGKYHRVRYAQYRFYKYAIGTKGGNYLKWRPHHRTGGLNSGSDYDPPPFDANHAVKLTSGGAERHKVQSQVWGIGVVLAGLNLDSRSAFASNTSVTWKPVSGCGQTRWLWGTGPITPRLG